MRRRDWVILALALLVAGAAAFGVMRGAVLQTGSWGLSFREPGVAPIGNAGVDQLRALDAAYLGDTSERVIYLTFDAGYENGCTEQILDVLKKHQVPAAFFLVGSYIRQHPDLVRRMEAEGHTVGNHTMHHYDMSKISDPDAFRKELEDLEAIYQEIVGKPMEKFYRPPQGIYSEGEFEAGPGAGVQDGILEPGLCGLEAGFPAQPRGGLRQAHPPHPPRRGGAAALHQPDQRRNSGRAADPLGSPGLPLRPDRRAVWPGIKIWLQGTGSVYRFK